jgi:hypothetical protein
MPFRNEFESPLTFERILKWVLVRAQPQIVGSLLPYIAAICADTFGGSSLWLGDFDVLPTEEAGVDGPGTWANHRQRDAKDCENA